MLSISGGTVRQVIESELQNKYKINFYIKDVADFGIPQHRKRAIIIGNRLGLRNPDIEGEYSSYDPAKKPHVTVYDAISDLPRIKSGGGIEFMKYPARKYISSYAGERRKCSDGVYNHTARTHSDRDLKIFSMLRAGEWINDLPVHFNPYRCCCSVKFTF